MLRKTRHLLEYALILGLKSLLGMLPESFRQKVPSFIAAVWFALDSYRREIARRNILRAMPEVYNKTNVDTVVREVFENIVRTAFEMILRINGNDFDWVRQNVRIVGGENIENALKQGKGIIFFTGHYGNWEVSSIKVSLEYGKVTSVYRPLDNPYLNQMVLESRLGFNQEMAPKQGALRKLLKALKNKETVGLLVDQHVSPHVDGIWVDFFGRKSATSPIIAQLHKHTRAPVLPVYTERMADGTITIEVEKEMELTTGDDEIERNTQLVNDVLERQIRKKPGQWLWIHKRWKTSPDEKPL